MENNKYKAGDFSKNIDKKIKNTEIAKIINSLQQPIKKVIECLKLK